MRAFNVHMCEIVCCLWAYVCVHRSAYFSVFVCVYVHGNIPACIYVCVHLYLRNCIKRIPMSPGDCDWLSYKMIMCVYVFLLLYVCKCMCSHPSLCVHVCVSTLVCVHMSV